MSQVDVTGKCPRRTGRTEPMTTVTTGGTGVSTHIAHHLAVTASAVVDRVVTDRSGKTDMLAGLRRIGIDEIAHRRGHRYLTCIVDHDTGRLVWAAPGRNSDTLKGFSSICWERKDPSRVLCELAVGVGRPRNHGRRAGGTGPRRVPPPVPVGRFVT
jgi:hypothetical protein